MVLANAFLAYPSGYAKPLIVAVEFALTLSIGVALGMLAAGPPERVRQPFTPHLFGLTGAALVGFGLYGLITNPEPPQILAFNLLGSGVFLVFGVVSRRAAASGLGGDPVLRRWLLLRSLLPSRLRPWLSRWCCDFCRKPADPR